MPSHAEEAGVQLGPHYSLRPDGEAHPAIPPVHIASAGMPALTKPTC